MRKQILSALLALCMMLVLLPGTALAEESGAEVMEGSECSDLTREGEEAELQQDNAGGIAERLRNAKNGEVITLDRDYEEYLTADVAVYGGSETNPVVLDLNGHSLVMTLHDYKIGFTVCGALRITDSSGTDSGTIYIREISIDEYYGTYEYAVPLGVSGGNLTLDGGTIRGNINIRDHSTFTMNGGIITADIYQTVECFLYVKDSTFIMNGGEFVSNGLAVAIVCNSDTDVSLQLNGGTITYNLTYIGWVYIIDGFSKPSEVTAKGTVIRARLEDRFFGSHEGGICHSWMPDGYIATSEPDENGYYYSIPVPVTGVSLDKEAVSLLVGVQAELTAAVTPANANDSSCTWVSSDNQVASVSQSGKVTAISPGTARITVTTQDGGYTAECTVTVLRCTMNEYQINSVTLQDSNGEPLRQIPAGSFWVSLSVTNTLQTPSGNIPVLLASYDENGKYLGMVCEAKELPAGETAVRFLVKNPTRRTDSVKALLLSSLTALTPISEAAGWQP